MFKLLNILKKFMIYFFNIEFYNRLKFLNKIDVVVFLVFIICNF